MFDVTTGSCLVRRMSHDADVYGLTIHPMRPSLAVSSSRDTSLRFWEVTPPDARYASSRLRALLDPQALEALCGPPLSSLDESTKFHLSGVATARAAARVLRARGKHVLHWHEPCESGMARLRRTAVMKVVAQLFCESDGTREMWDLAQRFAESDAGRSLDDDDEGSSTAAAVASSVGKNPSRDLRTLFGGKGSEGIGAGGDVSTTPGVAVGPKVDQGLRGGGGIPLLQWCGDSTREIRERAQAADGVRLKDWVGSIGGPSKEDLLSTAARLHLRVGNLQAYCEVLVSQDRWDEALAVAPAAGLDFWRQLMGRRATALSKDGTEASLPYFAAIGNIEEMTNVLLARGDGVAAMALQQAVIDGCWSRVLDSSAPRPVPSSVKEAEHLVSGALGRRSKISRDLARSHTERGAAARAACQHLSVGNAKDAVESLVQGGLGLVAFALARALDVRPRVLPVRVFARALLQHGMWEEALGLLKAEGESVLDVAIVASQFRGSPEETSHLYARTGLRPRDSWRSDAAAMEGSGRFVDAVGMHVAACAWPRAAELGCRAARQALLEETWDGVALGRLGFILAHVPVSELASPLAAHVQCVCATVGGYLALGAHSLEVGSSMFRIVRRLVSEHSIQCLGVSVSRLACIEAKAFIEARQFSRAKKLLEQHGDTVMGGEIDVAGVDPLPPSATRVIPSATAESVVRLSAQCAAAAEGEDGTLIQREYFVVDGSRLPQPTRLDAPSSGLSLAESSAVSGTVAGGHRVWLNRPGSVWCHAHEALEWSLWNGFNPLADGSTVPTAFV
jgi:hypothetical protein